MKILKRFIASLLPLLLVVTLLSGNAQAALLDVGPTVPQVINSSAPVGHGFPSWYRDTNRLPLEPCMNEAMCFFAPPIIGPPVSFPGNIPSELFYFAAGAIIPLASGGQAILVQAIEAAYSTGNVVPGAQVSFARIRIRIDTPIAGQYVVTTPYKQFTFDVTDVAAGISYVEDIGIGANGNFTGALAGNVGPFLYCTDAPFPPTDGSGGSYIGKNALNCPVLGSTFIPPGQTLPANYFRVQGPLGSNLGGAGINFKETDQFSVQGKIYEPVIPTPLTVDKAIYALDNTGMQVNAFATTLPLSNQMVGGTAFPGKFALTNVASALQLSGTGIPALDLMTTNNPADGKFFSASGLFNASGVTFPATVTVTNTTDSPATVLQNVLLVDEVVIKNAVYNPNPLTKTLSITAVSYDKLNNPILTAFMPGMTAPLGLLTNGQLNVTFPFTDNSVNPAKTYAIPPQTITVSSTNGGSATVPVNIFIPPPAPIAVADAATTAVATAVTISVLDNDTTTAALDFTTVAIVAAPLATQGTATVNATTGTITFTPAAGFYGTATFTYNVKDNFGQVSNTATVTVTVIPAALVITNAPTQTPYILGAGVFAPTTLAATGGIAPYTWAVAPLSTLPAGLTLVNGVLAGTPTAAGSFIFNLQVTDSQAPAVITIKAFTLVVSPAALVITNAPTLSPYILGAGAYAPTTLAATGGIAPYTWTVAAGSTLPAGLTLAADVLSGTPATVGAFNFSLQVTDSQFPAVTTVKAFILVVSPALAITTTNPLTAYTLGAGAYAPTTLTAIGGATPYTWAVAAGSTLPAGLTLSAVGVLSGTPTTAGTFSFFLQLTDSQIPVVSISKAFSLVVSTPVPIFTGLAIVLNAGAVATNSTIVTATLAATSSAGAVMQMQFSKDGGATYSALETYAPTRAGITLTAGQGINTILVRFKDALGNLSAPVSDGITLDTTKPVGTIIFTTPTPTTSTTGVLGLSATDNVGGSGVTQMQFSKDGVNFFAFETFATTRTVTLATGVNTLSVRFKDGAGNVSASVSASITRQ